MTDLWRMSATDIAQAVRSKQVSAVEVTQARLERIESINPIINAVVQEFPDEALLAEKWWIILLYKAEDQAFYAVFLFRKK
jgi:amidase